MFNCNSIECSLYIWRAQDNAPAAAADAHADLNAASQNPIASLISLPLQFNFYLGNGDYDRTSYTFNVQPVIPAKVFKDWSMINRIIIPVMIQPDISAETGLNAPA